MRVPVLLAVLSLLPLPWQQALAQAPQPAAPVAAPEDYLPRSGDAWVDQHLADINAYAARYPDSFLDDVARYAGVRRGYVEALLRQQRWQAGDIYFACQWAHVTNQSCRTLVQAWSRDHADGWEGVVEGLPIAPDNLHYRVLRHAIVASYDRWERPITLDPLLRRQLGDHAQRLQRMRDAAQAAQAADDARL